MSTSDAIDTLTGQLKHFEMPGNLEKPECEVLIIRSSAPGYLTATAQCFEWLAENVGKCMVDWGLSEDDGISDLPVPDVYQKWQFRDKSKAMLFKLRWVGL